MYEAVHEAKMAARRSSAKCTLKQLGLAFEIYADENQGLPPQDFYGDSDELLYSWAVPLLPYMDELSLYNKIDLKKPWDHPSQKELFKTPARMLTGCGRDPEYCSSGFPLAFYSVNQRLLDPRENVQFNQVTDGTSNTLLIGEIKEGLAAWPKPGNVRDPALGFNRGPKTFGSNWDGVTQFTFADGSVRAISNDIDPAILKALATPDAGDDLKGYVP